LILAFLQNQWVPPEYVDRQQAKAESLDAHEYQHWVKRCLFNGCRSGQVLLNAFGEDWIRMMSFDNASRRVGSRASACYAADRDHIKASINAACPQVIIAFGKVAAAALSEVRDIDVPLLLAPHPVARGVAVMPAYKKLADKIRDIICFTECPHCEQETVDGSHCQQCGQSMYEEVAS
jgi:hypothetical protein